MPAKAKPQQALAPEKLTASQVEFLNKTSLGTVVRAKGADLKKELSRMKRALGPDSPKYDLRVALRLKPVKEDCGWVGSCCHATCNCAVWG